jgi:uncharacterized cupin superfamily protein
MIVQLSQVDACILSDSSAVAVPLGTPVATTSWQETLASDGAEAGVWECTPGRWRRQIIQAEFCHFTQGQCRFIPDHGAVIDIKAGDALYFPANSLGIWEIAETVRKSYVLLP